MLIKKHYALLLKIFNSEYCFDKRDNTLRRSNRKIALWLKVPKSNIDYLIRKLKANRLLKLIQCIDGDHWMLSPHFLHRQITKHTIKSHNFTLALYNLGSHKKAMEWLHTCWYWECFIDSSTGEILDKKNIHFLLPVLQLSSLRNRAINIKVSHPESPYTPL